MRVSNTGKAVRHMRYFRLKRKVGNAKVTIWGLEKKMDNCFRRNDLQGFEIRAEGAN